MNYFRELLIIQILIFSVNVANSAEKVVVIPLKSHVKGYEGEFMGKTNQDFNVSISVHEGKVSWRFGALITNNGCNLYDVYNSTFNCFEDVCTGTDSFDCYCGANNGGGLSGIYNKYTDSWSGAWYAQSDACQAEVYGSYTATRLSKSSELLFDCKENLNSCEENLTQCQDELTQCQETSTCSGTLYGTRWCDNLNGAVTDLTTGLVWLKNANCFGTKNWVNTTTWDDALTAAGTLHNGTCGLTDNSVVGDWSLPTKNELYELANGVEAVRTDTPRVFSNIQSSYYYSSTTYESVSQNVWAIYFNDGSLFAGSKNEFYHTLPVRRGGI